MVSLTVPAKPDRLKVDSGEVYSLSATDTCDDCGCQVNEHVMVPGYSRLRRLCNGDLVRPL